MQALTFLLDGKGQADYKTNKKDVPVLPKLLYGTLKLIQSEKVQQKISFVSA